MPELLKNRYNGGFLHGLALRITAVYPSFQADAFVNGIMDETWDALGLKARMRRITVNLGRYLPTGYEQALGILDKVIAGYPAGFNDFSFMFFPDFVEVYGQEERHWELSMAALERYTPYSSSEFAVRPFIMRYEERMMRQMAAWAGHGNEHVRRLASEGCRPLLPWGQALEGFKKDPLPVLAILEQLKADPSPYVRKSVANNLNDISKNHPALVVKIAGEWYGKGERTDWIVKHGCRTLLKQGHRELLGLFGFADTDGVRVGSFALGAASVFIGGDITFSFTIEAKKATGVRLEYAIEYVKTNGKRSRRIFQISELSFKGNEKKCYTRAHSFADISTRKHYPGTHSVTLIVNGAERGTLEFEVLPQKTMMERSLLRRQ